MNSKLSEKIIEYLKSCKEPQAIETIRKGAGIAHWNAALSNCLELYIEGSIKGMKTSRSWVFWVEAKQQGGK